MCIFDMLSTSAPSTKPVMIQYEIRICEKEEYIQSDASSCKVGATFNHRSRLTSFETNYAIYLLQQSSTDTLSSPPVYEAKPPTTVTISSPRRKSSFFSRCFSRKHKKASRTSQHLPSYRETEIAEAWAKVGIDVNNRKQGPRPKCTPEELLEAMNGLFGKAAV